jgi:DNA ligase-1
MNENKPYFFPTLYNETEVRKIIEWSISVQWIDNIPTIVTVFGYGDGKKQTTMLKILHGKNIGRSNQTTPYEQALSEAKSKWEKKQLENYRQNVNDDKQLLPMLAHKYVDHKHKIVWPAYGQSKLNGVRCLAFIENDTVLYISRKGKTYETFSHWDDDLKNLFPSGTILDGEAFNPDLGFQEIIRRVKRVKTSRSNIEDNPLQYWIYDVVLPKVCYDARLAFLKERNDTDHIKIVPTYLLESEVQLKRYHQRNLIDGYEGTMIRSRHGMYKPDRRSYDLLKYKDFLDEEFEIIGGRSAQGRDEGTVIFECKTKSGLTFNVRPKGTWDERKDYLDNLNEYVGQMLTVRFQEKSEDGVPIFPVGLSVRDFE